MSTATRPASSTRTSTSSKTPPPPLKQHPTTLLHPSCSLTGTDPITLSANSIVQLRTKLISTYGPVSVAEGAIISERCSIGLLTPSPSKAAGDDAAAAATAAMGGPGGCSIGRGVVIGPACVIEAASVGAYSVIEAGVRLGRGVVVGDGAKVCARVELGDGDVVRSGEVVWGPGWGERRMDWGMGKGGDGVRIRKEGVEGLGEVMRRVWTGK